jgi:prepilin-type N-terminal cleavage/methylation domain-containing protein
MKTNIRNPRGFTLVELLVVIVIIAALAGLTAPMVIRQRKKADQTEAISNARQIGFALLEFENSYGRFPDSSTAEEVRLNTETTLPLGTRSSNDYFRQLIASEICQSETMFYAKTTYTKKPDNVYNTAQKALDRGEVGFGYIMNNEGGGEQGFSTAGNPSRPVAAAPLAYPFSNGKFDPDMYDLKAVVLRVDNSVQSLPVLRSNQLAQLGGGKNLLQRGSDTVWGEGANPVMINPEPITGGSRVQTEGSKLETQPGM